MKNYMHITSIMAAFICSTAMAMEKEAITYHKATLDDTQQLLHIINEHGINDKNKIVILPEMFREGALKQDIRNQKLFCAKQGSDIVAFKKLFIITDSIEYGEITTDEIRSHRSPSCLANNQMIDPFTNAYRKSNLTRKDPLFTRNDSFVIYFGGDYTLPSHRNKKINSTLIRHAFDEIKPATINALNNNNNLTKIILLYGLTKANAGEDGGIDRTPSIAKAFKEFLTSIAHSCNYNDLMLLSLHRYNSFMPTFDLQGTECKPLPEDQAIPGYGNVLMFRLIKKSTNKGS